jgi:hypothetical protein
MDEREREKGFEPSTLHGHSATGNDKQRQIWWIRRALSHAVNPWRDLSVGIGSDGLPVRPHKGSAWTALLETRVACLQSRIDRLVEGTAAYGPFPGPWDRCGVAGALKGRPVVCTLHYAHPGPHGADFGACWDRSGAAEVRR